MATILVVDDDDASRAVLVELLAAHGHSLLEATDGGEALERISSLRPELVITDILMPSMDGYELVRRLREIAAVASTPVIFASAYYLEREALALARNCGVAQILRKPIDHEIVLATVAAVLGDATRVHPSSTGVDITDQHVRLLTGKLAATNDRLLTANLRLSAILALSRELAWQSDPQLLLSRFCASARELIGANAAVVAVIDEGEDDFTHLVTSGAEAGRAEWLATAVRATKALNLLSFERRALRLSSLALPDPQGSPASVLAVAIVSLHQFFGWLCLVGKLGLPDFSEEDERMAEVLAAETGRVYENGRLLTHLRRQTSELQTEIEVSRALAHAGHELITALGTPSLGQNLCELSNTLVGCDRSYTLLHRSADDSYAIVAARGEHHERWEALRVVHLPRRVFARLSEILRRQDSYEIATPEIVGGWGTVLTQYEIQRTLCTPLKRGGVIVGFQMAVRGQIDQPFSATQTRIAIGVAQLGSLALENARLMLELSEANRLKSDFVATMSHELRTPLNIILGYNDLVMEGAFGEVNGNQAEVLQRVHESAISLLTLINNLLDLGRLEVGRDVLVHREVNVANLLAEVVREVAPQQIPAAVEIVLRVEATLPMVYTDAVKVRVVVKNLLGNALKFTPAGRIDLEAAPHSDGVEIRVRDTGPGIHPDVLPFIFDAFRQGANVNTRTHGGVGLGLYIARRLLELLGGTITVESQLGAGSLFRFHLPAGTAPDATDTNN